MATSSPTRLPLRIALVALIAACTATACSDDDSGGSTGNTTPTGTPVALESFGAELAPVLCDIVKTCQGPLYDIAFTDPSLCTKRLADEFQEGTYPNLKAAIDKGNATYNGNAVGDCLAKIKALGCGFETARLGDVCKEALAGKLAAGTDCTLSAECAPGLFCKTGGSCPGKCADPLAAGSACEKSEDCQAGLVCDTDDAGSRTCVKPAVEGEPCEQGKPPCAINVLCVGSDAKNKTPGTCKAPTAVLSAAQGAACDITKTELCTKDLSCQLDKLDQTGATFACAGKVASGAACKLAYPSVCPAGEYCEGLDLGKGVFEGTCKPEPTEGQACAAGGVGSGCAAGLSCVKDKCVAPAKNGAACTEDSECLGDCVKGVCSPETLCK